MLICFDNFAGADPQWLGGMSDDGGGILFGTAVPRMITRLFKPLEY